MKMHMRLWQQEKPYIKPGTCSTAERGMLVCEDEPSSYEIVAFVDTYDDAVAYLSHNVRAVHHWANRWFFTACNQVDCPHHTITIPRHP